jgi:SAM-dependent methyltransferase
MGIAQPFDRAAALRDLATFYASQDGAASDPYLAGKITLSSGHRELVDAYGKIRFALRDAGAVLDWGCRHGVFAWLARRDLPTAGIWGCDVCDPAPYSTLHGQSGLHYAQLAHPWLLPYTDHSFDVVLGGGTLEHVANDGASLTELWRVLKPGGRLVLTHLPNATSLSEFVSRRWSPGRAHPRRYRLSPLRERLLQLGFLPLRGGHHQLLPATLPGAAGNAGKSRLVERAYAFNGALERLWPLNLLSTTLWVVAEKRLGF